MLPQLPTDAEFETLTHFPHEEGSHIEFKQTTSKICLLKMEETLCGFLNGTGGGHFICGVDDKTRRICWMKMTDKDRDKVRLKVDQIFHGKVIHDSDGQPLTQDNVKLRFVDIAAKGTLVIVTAVPSEGKTYRLYDTTWYRLNASNYKVREEKLYKLSTVNQMVSQANGLLRADYESLVAKQKERIGELERRQEELDDAYRNMNRCMLVVNDEMRRVKRETDETLEMLEKRILMEKAFVEEVLEKERGGWCWAFRAGWSGIW